MTDSLARLVLRAQGRLVTAEPLLASRYAPAGTVPAPDWAKPEASQTLETKAPASPAIGLRAVSLQPSALEHHRPRTAAMASDDSPVGISSVHTEPVQRRIEPGRPESSGAAVAAAAGQMLGSLEAISSRTGLPQVVAGSPEAPLGHSTPVVPALVVAVPRAAPALSEPAETPAVAAPSASRPEPAISPERLWLPDAPSSVPADGRTLAPPDFPVRRMQAAAPDVQISIGVVEVHAAPRRQAPARPTPAQRPQVSLADYLAQRRGRSP